MCIRDRSASEQEVVKPAVKVVMSPEAAAAAAAAAAQDTEAAADDDDDVTVEVNYIYVCVIMLCEV